MQERIEKKCIEYKIGKKQYEDMELTANNEVVNIDEYRDSCVFITGATGLVGSHLVKSLLYINEKKCLNLHIVAMIRNREKAEKVYGSLLKRNDFDLYVGDVLDSIDYKGRIDYIFHTASITASKIMVEHPVCTIDTAYQGTKNILELARRKTARGVVYVSSMEVYGSPDSNLEWITEKNLGFIDLENVRSSYSEGKRICECLCTAYANEYNIPIKVARLSQTFGAGIMESDNRVYVQFARSAMEQKDIVLHSDGTSEGNYCYIQDVVDALLILAVKGETGKSYNVVNEETHMQIKEMAALVAEKIADNKIKVVYDIPESSLKYGYAPAVKMKLCGEKMRSLGWQPRFNLRESYQRMISDM